MKSTLASIRILFALTILTGFVYPAIVWAAGQAFFSAKAEGSLISRDGKIIGSSLFSQKTTRPEYFWPRPSADDFATVASGASNLAWTSDKLQKSVTDLTQAFHQANPGSGNAAVPEEMVTASASGLDPEISLAAARLQEARVASARHLTPAQTDRLASLVNGYASTESFAPSRVNVLVLNVAVDAEFANGKGH